MKSFEVVLEFKMKVKSKMQRNSSKDIFKDFSFELIHPKSGVETVPKYVLKFPFNPSARFHNVYWPIFSPNIFTPNIFRPNISSQYFRPIFPPSFPFLTKILVGSIWHFWTKKVKLIVYLLFTTSDSNHIFR